MKILVSITAALLIAVSGGSGFCIWNLDRQIDDSMNRLQDSVQEMIENLNDTIDTDEELIFTDIDEIHHTLADYSLSLHEEITETETKIAGCAQRTADLKVKTTATEEYIESHLVEAQSIYEKAREATVRIAWRGYHIGSGFIVSFPTRYGSYEEYVITSYDVAEIPIYVQILDDMFYPTFRITLNDGRVYRVTLYACSKEMNIALLKFVPFKSTEPYSIRDFRPLPSLTLADSSDISVADPVFVIGSPDDEETYRLGLKDSLTAGIISQTGRISNLIQFDTAVNIGESGSPLLNKNADVIGIFLYRVNPLFGEGVSFAAPSNQVKKIGALLTGNSAIMMLREPVYIYDYPDTGITVADLLPKDIVANGNTIHSGVKVTELSTTADIRKGDIITGIDDYPVQTSDDFYSCIVEHYSTGDEITLRIIRDGNEIFSPLILD